MAKAIAAGDEPPHRRDLILEAAIELFRAKGFDATGIDEIGAAAGVTGPAVYRHYESKQDILDWAVRVGTTEVLRTERKIVAGAGSPGRRSRSSSPSSSNRCWTALRSSRCCCENGATSARPATVIGRARSALTRPSG